MEIKDHYLINQQLNFMVEHYDQFGYLCSIINEVGSTFLVKTSPTQILENSIRMIGFNLSGARKSAREILGDINMYPVMVNPIQGICMLPTKSAAQTIIWINPNQVYRTTQNGRRTNVIFKNGYILEVAPILSSFNHKLHCAEQLRDITVGIGKDPISVIADPHTKKFLYPTKKHVHKRKKEKSIQRKKFKQEEKELKGEITLHSIASVEQIDQFNYKGKQYTLKLYTLLDGMMFSFAYHQEDFEKDGPKANSGIAEPQEDREAAIKFAILNLLHGKK